MMASGAVLAHDRSMVLISWYLVQRSSSSLCSAASLVCIRPLRAVDVAELSLRPRLGCPLGCHQDPGTISVKRHLTCLGLVTSTTLQLLPSTHKPDCQRFPVPSACGRSTASAVVGTGHDQVADVISPLDHSMLWRAPESGACVISLQHAVCCLSSRLASPPWPCTQPLRSPCLSELPGRSKSCPRTSALQRLTWSPMQSLSGP